MQRSCAVHAVFNEPQYNRKGELLWAIVNGYEAIGTVFDGERRRKVINRFSIGFARASIAKELKFHGLAYFLRLILIKDYRSSLSVSSVSFSNSVAESNVTTHVKIFYLYGYDLTKSLTEGSKRLMTIEKRAVNLPNKSKSFKSSLTDVTDDEIGQWLRSVISIFDQFAERRISAHY